MPTVMRVFGAPLGAGNKVCDVMLRGMLTAPREGWE